MTKMAQKPPQTRVIAHVHFPVLNCGTSQEGPELPQGTVQVSLERLWEKEVSVQGEGSQVAGIDLLSGDEVRIRAGDDTAFAQRNYLDSAWASFADSAARVVTGAVVQWVRIPLGVAEELKGVPLLLNVESRFPFTLYLDGRMIVQSNAVNAPFGGLPTDSLGVGRMLVPLVLMGDGHLESLALRVETPLGKSLASAHLGITLHAKDSTWHLHRVLINHGVFIGINVIIMLMSLVIGLAERRDKGWLLLAALSFASVLDTLCVLGGGMGALGLSDDQASMLQSFRIVTVPWGMFLLIMVLLELNGSRTRRHTVRYGIGIGIITIMSLALFLMSPWLNGQVTIGLTDFSSSGQLAMVVALVIAIVAGAGIIGWFAIAEVKLGMRLWRSKGYARWVGAGAVAASLLTVVLAVASNFAGLALSSWLSVLADYCSFVAVPVSVAIYLSIRSAHHARLVTRQRDELDREVHERTAELRTEKERSDELLLNILPHEVAEELKNTGAAAAKHFDQATVLFSDFRGFTQLSEKLSPEQLVREIDTCFKHFDGLMDKWGMEKIKTIGDAYMAAGGLPDPGKGSPADVVHAALEMQEFMEDLARRRKAQGLPVFHMRVGIHTGPVVAGIVGVKKFQYDIWGDTVNTASRMESSGEVGRVNISEATYALVKDVVSSQLSVVSARVGSRTTGNQQLTTPAFNFTPRGRIQAKGKGEMEMYFVNRAGFPMPPPAGDA
jgi:class 3 adenylate cyclase